MRHDKGSCNIKAEPEPAVWRKVIAPSVPSCESRRAVITEVASRYRTSSSCRGSCASSIGAASGLGAATGLRSQGCLSGHPRSPRPRDRARAPALPASGATCTTATSRRAEPLNRVITQQSASPGTARLATRGQALVEPRVVERSREQEAHLGEERRAIAARPRHEARRDRLRQQPRALRAELVALDRVAHGADQQPLVGLALDEVILRTGLDHAGPERLVVAASEDHNRNGGRDAVKVLDAVHAGRVGEREVEEHHVDAAGDEARPSGREALDVGNLDPVRSARQRCAHPIGVAGVVFHQQDAEHARRGRGQGRDHGLAGFVG